MMDALRKFRDRIRGVGQYSITVPPMDGTLRPNQELEEAEVLLETSDPDHLDVHDGALWFASEKLLFRMAPGDKPVQISEFDSPITAFAVAASGEPAVALLNGSAHFPAGYAFDDLGCNTRCITRLAFDRSGNLFVTCGSQENTANDWARDLLLRGATGSVWRIPKNGKAQCLAKGLAWPAGILAEANDHVLVVEASASRIIRVGAKQSVHTILANLPGYPADIRTAEDRGYHLAIMAPRNQLIEFMLREQEFVRDMIASSPKEYWIAPTLNPPESFLEPLQGGALKQLGIMKPWAPSRSIGLVVRLNSDFVATSSHHSRADGRNHGTTSCVEWNGSLIVASRGNHCLLRLPLEGDKS